MLNPVKNRLNGTERPLLDTWSELYFCNRLAGMTGSIRGRGRPWLESLDNNVYIALREVPL